MGTTGALGMAEAVAGGLTTLEHALSWHLTANHFPPVPTSMIPACLAAIDAANAEDWDEEIALPDGVTYRDGRSVAPAWAIVEQHHLDAFLDGDDWDGEEA